MSLCRDVCFQGHVLSVGTIYFAMALSKISWGSAFQSQQTPHCRGFRFMPFPGLRNQHCTGARH